jgi:hypothetical protein
MILHCGHFLLTEAFTFIPRVTFLEALDDPSLSPIGVEFNGNFVANEDSDTIHPHSSR